MTWVSLPKKETENPCTRCHGTGYFVVAITNNKPVLSPHDEGVCWDCLGTGKKEEQDRNKLGKKGGYHQPSLFNDKGGDNIQQLFRTKVTVGKATREVIVVDIRESFICGFLGRAWFAWNTEKYDKPMIKIKAKRFTDRDRDLAKAFLLPVIKQLEEGVDTPLHGSGNVGSSDSNSSSVNDSYVSSVPKWMLEEYKEWKPCYSRETGELLYHRRTRFKQDYLDMVADWKEYCSKCIYRSGCVEQCEDREGNSGKKILR